MNVRPIGLLLTSRTLNTKVATAYHLRSHNSLHWIFYKDARMRGVNVDAV